MSLQLNTIGFAGKNLEEFVGLLRSADVSKVIDARLRPDTQLSAYARQRDLRYILEHYEGITYEHNPALTPTPEILDDYRSSKDWDAYVRGFAELISEREMSACLEQSAKAHESVAILCSEATPEKCHRRLVAEDYSLSRTGVTIRHL